MKLFQFLLILLSLIMSIYTFQVISQYGINIIPLFFGEIQALNWQGQFNFDFACFLLIAGLWIAWRKNFSAKGIFLGIITTILGILFFAPYILLETIRLKGNTVDLLLGEQRKE